MVSLAERRTRRLVRFATANGLQFALEPAQQRRTPAVFRAQDWRIAVGWFGVPGPTGFEVGQHVAFVEYGDGDASGTRWTWGVFTLRTEAAGREVALQIVDGVLPRQWSAQLSGDQLVIFSQGWMRLRSRKLWERMSTVAQVLAPLLAQPERTSSSAERQRRGVPLAIEQ